MLFRAEGRQLRLSDSFALHKRDATATSSVHSVSHARIHEFIVTQIRILGMEFVKTSDHWLIRESLQNTADSLVRSSCIEYSLIVAFPTDYWDLSEENAQFGGRVPEQYSSERRRYSI